MGGRRLYGQVCLGVVWTLVSSPVAGATPSWLGDPQGRDLQQVSSFRRICL